MADPLISIMIAVYILYSAVGVGRESMDVLMDRRLPADIDERIAEIVGQFRDRGVLGFHDLRTRRSGSQKFIDLHLEVERDQRLQEAHDIQCKCCAPSSERYRARAYTSTPIRDRNRFSV